MSGAPTRVFRGASHLITNVLRDWFTDSTGQGYSIGRALGVYVIFLGTTAPIAVGIFMAVQLDKPTMADWVSFIGSLVPYFPAVAAAGSVLILGAGATDPGGAWWSRSNAPPSTTTVEREVSRGPPPTATETTTRTPGPPAQGERNDLAQ